MDKHSQCVRGFSIASEAWYSKVFADDDDLDHINVGMYNPAGGTTGEFCIRWIDLGGNASPKLEVFDDAWGALQLFADVLRWMAEVDGKNVCVKEFADALRAMGVKDLTQRHEPAPKIPELAGIQDALPH